MRGEAALVDPICGALGSLGERMATSPHRSQHGDGVASTRAQMEEARGKLDISEEEATPLAIDDLEEGAEQKWLIAGKVLYRNLYHIQTISNALRPAWGNPRGLVFRPLGENMFVAEFEPKRDRDRVWDGSPWHLSKNAIILSEFEECMKPSELCFDKLQVWIRILNLPFNLRNSLWGLRIARQLDEKASHAQIDPVGGYLRARITIDVTKPLRRWVVVDSTRRQCRDWYDVVYEQIPHFCFSCGRLGHADLMCPSPGTRDENGALPFKPSLRAQDDWRKANSGDSSSKDNQESQSSRRESKNSSTQKENEKEVTSPVKKSNFQNKRRGGPQKQIYQRVEYPSLPAPMENVAGNELAVVVGRSREEVTDSGVDNLSMGRETKKEKTNSAKL